MPGNKKTNLLISHRLVLYGLIGIYREMEIEREMDREMEREMQKDMERGIEKDRREIE